MSNEEPEDAYTPVQRASLDRTPSWAPADCVHWMEKMREKLPTEEWNVNAVLLTDSRMQEVWEWHESVKTKATREIFGTPLSLCLSVNRALRLPAKPGNMTSVKRDQYFERVRHHTNALLGLLSGTRYSSNSANYGWQEMHELEDETLSAQVVRDLASWGEDECGHIVAYRVDEDGVSRLPWTYPESSLYDLLCDVLDWTTWEDGWGWDFTRSSRPLDTTQSRTAHIVYFNCVLYDDLHGHGLEVPFSVLATIANVALNLSINDQLDEDSVRKQVRRFHNRNGQPKPPQRDWSF